jgi:ABC-type transport system involved in multi-copper enzyme maturation permease subunit
MTKQPNVVTGVGRLLIYFALCFYLTAFLFMYFKGNAGSISVFHRAVPNYLVCSTLTFAGLSLNSMALLTSDYYRQRQKFMLVAITLMLVFCLISVGLSWVDLRA